MGRLSSPLQWLPRNTNLESCVKMSSSILPWHVYYDVENFSWDLSTPQVAKQKGLSTSNQKSPKLRQDPFGWVFELKICPLWCTKSYNFA